MYIITHIHTLLLQIVIYLRSRYSLFLSLFLSNNHRFRYLRTKMKIHFVTLLVSFSFSLALSLLYHTHTHTHLYTMVKGKVHLGVSQPLSLVGPSEKDRMLEKQLEAALQKYNMYESREVSLLRYISAILSLSYMDH